MTRRNYCKHENQILQTASVTNKTLVLPFEEETYTSLLQDKVGYKAHITALFQRHPEVFPETMSEGWSLFGLTRPSAKQQIQQRRLLMHATRDVWQVRPAFMMPYMTCDTATAEKILFLAKWAPTWALARVFEKDVMAVYRLSLSVGRYNLVGTTVKTPELPTDLGADEKHTRLAGQRVYLATTVAKNCFLGASVSPAADTEHLTQAYRQFQQEAHQVQPKYQPKTVNTDGWLATTAAWQALFPMICVIPCFLHAILGIKQVMTTATRALYGLITEQAWHVYQAANKRCFSQRMRRLRERADTLADSPVKVKLLKLCQKKSGFLPAYDFPTCLRTSNMIDRLMQGLDKYLFAKRYFHGTLASAERAVRAYCLLTNFRPTVYNPIAHSSRGGTRSPFQQLNGFTYHGCWLQNLLIATSRQKIYRFQYKKLE